MFRTIVHSPFLYLHGSHSTQEVSSESSSSFKEGVNLLDRDSSTPSSAPHRINENVWDPRTFFSGSLGPGLGSFSLGPLGSGLGEPGS